jgi:hypothetical protein
MGNPAYNNDYTAREIYESHLKEANKRHDALRFQWVTISNIPFDPDFAAFADSVAYAIRGLVIYRSDGGRYARGLVRAQAIFWRFTGRIWRCRRGLPMVRRFVWALR